MSVRRMRALEAYNQERATVNVRLPEHLEAVMRQVFLTGYMRGIQAAVDSKANDHDPVDEYLDCELLKIYESVRIVHQRFIRDRHDSALGIIIGVGSWKTPE